MIDRAAAAQLLGVPKDASAGDVQRAFRQKVKTVHPDAAGRSDENATTVDQLRAARELLLEPPPAVAAPPRVDPQTAPTRPPSPPAPEPMYESERDPYRRSTGAVIFGAVLLAGLALVLIIAAMILIAPDEANPSPSSPSDDGECLTIDVEGVASAVDCSTPGALEVFTVTDGLAACVSSMETLRVNDQTWCLRRVRE